jgi:hypothetical protein
MGARRQWREGAWSLVSCVRCAPVLFHNHRLTGFTHVAFATEAIACAGAVRENVVIAVWLPRGMRFATWWWQ